MPSISLAASSVMVPQTQNNTPCSHFHVCHIVPTCLLLPKGLSDLGLVETTHGLFVLQVGLTFHWWACKSELLTKRACSAVFFFLPRLLLLGCLLWFAQNARVNSFFLPCFANQFSCCWTWLIWVRKLGNLFQIWKSFLDKFVSSFIYFTFDIPHLLATVDRSIQNRLFVFAPRKTNQNAKKKKKIKIHLFEQACVLCSLVTFEQWWPSAAKPGLPYGVMYVSSSLACRTPDPWITPLPRPILT